jgi:hypothetical protein
MGNPIVIAVLVGYCAHEAAVTLQAFAGKTSFADLRLGFLTDIKVVYTLSLATSGFAVALYLRERRLHRKVRERLTARILKLELMIDPIRTSSHLTPEGLTRKEDK